MKRYKSDLDFLENYWKDTKAIADKIKNEMPLGTADKNSLKFLNKDSGSKIFIVNFSDLKDSWDPNTVASKIAGKSKNLEALSDKIHYMILKGRAADVKPMIEKICSGRIKSFSQGLSKSQIKTNNLKFSDDLRERLVSVTYNKEFLGRGHFRWNFRVYTLDNFEINHLKKYFEL